MCIIWPCDLSVEEYAAAGKNVAVPRQRCPSCDALTIFSSGYLRSVRAGKVFRVWVRRARCQRCPNKPSHALLPSFCLVRRLDAVEVIGPAVKAVSCGAGTRSAAKTIGELFAYTTVRGWWRRHRERTGWLLGLLRAASAGCVASSAVTEGDAVTALETVGEALSAAVGIPMWSAVSLFSGGMWLATSTTLTTADPGWVWMAVMTGRGSTIPP
jgi:hypothetical protein